MGLLIAVLGIVAIAVGLALIGGFGFAMLIIDMFTQGTPTDYHQDQKAHPGSKSKKNRKLGLFLIIIGGILLFYGAINLS